MSVTDADSPYSLQFWLSEYEEHNDWPAVRRIARQLLHLMPDHPEGLRYLAEAQFRLGEPQAAYSAALRLTKISPWCPDGFWILADLYAQADEPERSAAFLEQTARRIPGCDTIWAETARAYFHLGHWGRCLVAADHGLRINRCNIRLWILKVLTLLQLQRVEAAKTAADRLLDLGVEAEDLRNAASEMGITGATLAAIRQFTRKGLPITAKSRGKSHAATGIAAAVEIVQDTLSKRQPLTREQFDLAWQTAQARREQIEALPGHEDDPAAHTTPNAHDLQADEVAYIYDRYRVWGPYSFQRIRTMLLHGEFSLREAWLRPEEARDWTPVADYFPDLSPHM